MATHAELDTRGWYPGAGKGLEGLAPGEAIPEEPKARTYAVVFLDRAKRGYGAPRPAQIDCLPAQWTRLDSAGEPGTGSYTQRTWRLTYGSAGPVYREQEPAPFKPTAYKPGGGVQNKGKRPRILPDVEPAEEWA